MDFLHVQTAVALPRGLIGARSKLAFEQQGRLGVLVVHMAVSLPFRGPTNLKVNAGTVRAFPGPRMSFLMFRDVARPLKDPIAVLALFWLLPLLFGLLRLLARYLLLFRHGGMP